MGNIYQGNPELCGIFIIQSWQRCLFKVTSGVCQLLMAQEIPSHSRKVCFQLQELAPRRQDSQLPAFLVELAVCLSSGSQTYTASVGGLR